MVDKLEKCNQYQYPKLIEKINRRFDCLKLERCIQSMETELFKLEQFTNNPVQVLADYCDQLRNEVDKMHEKHLAALIKYRDDLHMGIDQYEFECTSRIESQKKWMRENKSFIRENREIISEWKKSLKDVDLGQLEWEKAIEESDKTIIQLQIILEKLRALIFDGESFEKPDKEEIKDRSPPINIQTDKEEKVEEKSEPTNSLIEPFWHSIIGTDHYREIPLSNILNSKLSNPGAVCFDNGKLVVVGYSEESFKVNVFDEQECVAKLDSNYGRNTRYFLRSVGNKIAIKMCDYSTDELNGSTLTVLNDKLEVLAEKNLLGFVSLDEHNVYLLYIRTKLRRKIDVYDHSLNFRTSQVIRLSNLEVGKTKDFEIRKNKILINFYTSVAVYDLSTGHQIISLPVSHLIYSRSSFLFTHDQIIFLEKCSNNQILTLFTIKDGQYERIKLDFKNSISQVFLINEKFYFLCLNNLYKPLE